MILEEAMESLKLKFQSGNDINVERATILRTEYIVIRDEIKRLQIIEKDWRSYEEL